MTKSKRHKQLINPFVQGTVIVRLTVYWFYCNMAILMMGACWITYSEQPSSSKLMISRLAAQYGPAMLGSCLLLPFVWYDCQRLTNRIAGPIYRLRNAMRHLVRGGDVAPIRLRERDFWHEVAEDFNDLVARIEQLKTDQSRAAAPAEGKSTPAADHSFPSTCGPSK